MKIDRVVLIAVAIAAACVPFASSANADPLCTVSVKLLVDQKEPTVRQTWEKRYRDRLAAASAVFERTCHVRFKVVAVGTWVSDDKATDLLKLIDDFERKVKPAPAQLVVGFTGQFQTLKGDKHIGGARGPFRSHILIREWGQQITEPERLEILVHELGHYLGAVHSPERQSVMRPDISDRQSRALNFHISFDDRNTKVLCLISEELGKRPVAALGQLPAVTKERLRVIYQSLASALPDDPAAPRYLAMLGQSSGVAGEPSDRLKELIAGARTVVRAVTVAADKNQQLPKKGSSGTARATRLEGDQLTELYVRRAAGAAQRLPKNVAVPAFLVGLGVAMDDSPVLPNTPTTNNVWQKIESASARLTRVAVLGTPTMRGRRDLMQHFIVSAALTALDGPEHAEHVGLLKGVSDARAGAGFSFANLSADLAGVEFATAVVAGRVPMSRVESRFAVRDFLSDVGGLKEGITWNDFVKRYGFPPDARFTKEKDSLRAKALAMPGFHAASK
jgi:hypothetical protein